LIELDERVAPETAGGPFPFVLGSIMRFRPCIDLHKGKVKQIVGSTLSDNNSADLQTNFISANSPSYYAAMYKRDHLFGGHVIMLGPDNEEAARDALKAYPGGLQIGGGITSENAKYWLDQGASSVIITSYVFRNGKVLEDRLKQLLTAVDRQHLVLDLSCRKKGDAYYIVTDRWQKFTELVISPATLEYFAGFCTEFLIHAVDVEGKCRGIDKQLTENLGQWTPIPTTYAGGVQSMADMYLVKELGRDRLDVTVGSALDIFGGTGIRYADAVAFNRNQ